jgi:hypothetical protein
VLCGYVVVEISMDYKDIYIHIYIQFIYPLDKGLSVPKCFHRVRIQVHKTLVSG